MPQGSSLTFTHRNGPQSYLAISNLPTIIGGNTFINEDGMFMGGTESPTFVGYPDITAKVYGNGRIALEDSATIEDVADSVISSNAIGSFTTFDEMKEIVTYNNNGNDYIYSNITQHIIMFDSATFRLEVYSRHNRPFTQEPKFWEVPVSF